MAIFVDMTPTSLPSDFDSRVRFRNFATLVNCPVCEDVDCGCCASDFGGHKYVSDEDTIYLQFAYEDFINVEPQDPDIGWYKTGDTDWFVKLELYDSNGVLITDSIDDIATGWGVYWDEGSRQNAVIPMENIDVECFYFCIVVNAPQYLETGAFAGTGLELPDPVGYDNGQIFIVGNQIYILVNGAWKSQGELVDGTYYFDTTVGQWYIFLDGTLQKVPDPDIVENPTGAETRCCLRHYRKVRCVDSVLICSLRTSGEDCLGYRYNDVRGLGFGNYRYQNCLRIKGSFEPIAFPVEREVTDDGVLISGGFRERYQLRGDKLCLEDAKNLASIISNEDFLILDKTWEIVGDVVKDNDEGGLWYPTINFERTICDSKDSCGFDF